VTWYDVLEISHNARNEEIKASYRRLTLKRHPDAGGSTEAMREVLEAYRVLSDPSMRGEYDRTLMDRDRGEYFESKNFKEDILDRESIPQTVLVSRDPQIHRRQHVIMRSNGKVATFSRCAVGIHSIISIPLESCIVVLAIVRNLTSQVQPIRANDTDLIDNQGLQANGQTTVGDLWNADINALWPSSTEVQANAMTRLSMFYQWDGFAHPDRWTARWSYFEPGHTSGMVKGYIDMDISIRDLTQ